MVPTKRPAECCTPPVSVEPLPATERDELVAVLRALGEPMRLEIYRLIAAQDAPLCVCDVVERFPLQQPTISHHLRVLREARLVNVTRRWQVGVLQSQPATAWPCSRKRQCC